jgi:hypothetical protein
LNKRRAGELVRHGGFMADETHARAINAQPWEPMPGMVKRQCPKCRYFFAAAPDAEELRCPDCVGAARRLGRRPNSSENVDDAEPMPG